MSTGYAERKADTDSVSTIVTETNPLLALTPALLHHVAGKDRTDLLQYLRRWEAHAICLRYLDVWLAAQPELATLRQARAEALIALGRPESALPELDALDQERGNTAGRHQLRVRALIASQDWPALERLLEPMSLNDRGDILMAQEHFVEAKQAYAEASALHEGPPTLREARAALACQELGRAHALLVERLAMHGEARPAIAELRLQQEVAAAMGDDQALAAATTALDTWEASERADLIARLGLGTHEDLEVVPDVPATGHDDIVVPEEALALLHEHWGYDDFRGGQAATITRVLQGQSALAVLPTGAGKSLTYQLPALLLDGATVVVSPLIALMKDQLDGLPQAVRGLATAINSTLSASEVAQRLRDVASGRYRLVYVAPERLRQQAFVQALRSAGIARFVVDEAHCVSLWGLSFRPDYLFLRRVLQELNGPPVLALTATATPETRAEIIEQLGEMDLVAASVFRSNLHFSVVQVSNAEAKTAALVEQCGAIDGPILVYARSRDRCEELAHLLRRKGIAAGHYHAQVEDRGQVQEAFMRGEVRVLVATVAFGMGVDKSDIRAIIHYNLPQSVEAYYQEAGRAGRDGQPSHCVLLYTSGDKGQLTSWLRQDALDREDLRSVYRALRKHAVQGYARMPIELLCREAPGLEETQIRVALGMLERVGLLIRHFDLPRAMRVTLMEPGDDPLLAELETRAGLQWRVTQEIDPVALAVELGTRPDELEARLLQLSSAGFLRLDSGARDLLLELLPSPPDTPALIEALLQEYATRQDARIEAMVGYAKGLSCRHRALAAHFGERLAACGDACDVCAGEHTRKRTRTRSPAPASRRMQPAADTATATSAALRAVRDLPFAVGRTGLVRILTGSVESPIGPERCQEWGRLQGWTRTATERLVNELVDQGLLARNERGNYPVLELTDAGHTLTLED